MEDEGESRSLATVPSSPVYSDTSTDSVEVAWALNTQRATSIKYRNGREFLTDVANMVGGCVQLLIKYLSNVVHMAASDRNKYLIKPCATASASRALRATTLPPTLPRSPGWSATKCLGLPKRCAKMRSASCA